MASSNYCRRDCGVEIQPTLSVNRRDGEELLGLEAGPADERAVDVLDRQQLTVTPKRIQIAEHQNIASATAWTQRQLVFESASLADVADEFNRYNDRQLIVGDPRLETFHVSGVFSSTDPASLIRFLRARPELRIVETGSQIRIEKNTS